MKLSLADPRGRVARFMYREAPGGCTLALLDLHFGFRGEIYSYGGCVGHDYLIIQPVSTRTCRKDKIEFGRTLEVAWKTGKARRRVSVLDRWSKGSLTLLFAPLDSWMPDRTKDWTVIKDLPDLDA